VSAAPLTLDITHLGRLPYAQAYDAQVRTLDALLARRESSNLPPHAGTILTVEHDPVITISRRPGAREHLTATPAMLERAGVSVEETDRGGDITYHGPGQLVLYPILDLTLLNLGLHDYMRLLEQSVIDLCASFGLAAAREPGATGVWVPRADAPASKLCAMGVRVRRWISMHGLALNVTTNLDHFNLIIPCGLAGRSVTSLARELGPRCPSFTDTRDRLVDILAAHVRDAYARASAKRAAASEP
jgi:lipoyl(octanoyl) transferase